MPNNNPFVIDPSRPTPWATNPNQIEPVNTRNIGPPQNQQAMLMQMLQQYFQQKNANQMGPPAPGANLNPYGLGMGQQGSVNPQQFGNQQGLPRTGGKGPTQKGNNLLPGGRINNSFVEDSIVPGSSALFNMFGSDKQRFNPYVDSNGNYVFADPRQKTPVPISQVPGASYSPGKVSQRQSNNVQSLYNLLPYLNQAVNNTAVPSAIAGFNAQAAVSGPTAQLMTDLYNQYGPQLNNIGNQIMNANALSNAQTEQDVINGPGRGLVTSARDLSNVFDKPWFDTRDKTASALQEQLNGGLSQSERDEIGKGLARQNSANGTLNTPSQTNTVGNAMQYGQAARSRLSQAIQSASAFLPNARSGVDVFNVATGHSSMPNPGNGMFPGLSGSQSGQQGLGLAGQMFGGFNQTQGNIDNINANKKDWLDQFNQFASGLGSLTSGAKGAAGMFGM